MPQWSPVMKTGNTGERAFGAGRAAVASMEPGHEDREYLLGGRHAVHRVRASMEPGHEDREYAPPRRRHLREEGASMEPGHEDREYHPDGARRAGYRFASMEPGHEDREYSVIVEGTLQSLTPQWSPVMKTGNTGLLGGPLPPTHSPQWSPVMKTGNTTSR